MWHWLEDAITNHPEIAIFLALGLGFFLGKLKIAGLTLGPVTGTLLAGVVVGIIFTDVEIPDLVKTVAFVAFLFALGYSVGPQFFAGLKSGGVKQLILALINCVVGLFVVIILATLLGYGPGWGAGLLAGGLTQSAVIGVASAAIEALPGVDSGQAKTYESQIAVGYAVCYLFGTAAAAYFLSTIAPRMVGTKDLAAASNDLERDLGVAEDPDVRPAYGSVTRRAYRLTGDAVVGKTVADVRSAAQHAGFEVLIHEIRRGDQIIPASPNTVLESGDVAAVAARHSSVVGLNMDRTWGEETDDPVLLSYSVETLPVVVTKKGLAGKTIERAMGDHWPEVFVTKLVRGGREVPWSKDTPLHHGDEITLQGAQPAVEAAVNDIGYPDRTSDATDMSYVALGIVIGALIGVPAVTVAGAPIGLTTSGGALIMGLVFGWLRSRTPTFGRFPQPAIWLMNTGGLCMFVGIVGITSGPDFIDGVRKEGLGLVFAGLAVTLIPMLLSLYLGHRFFKFSTPILLGVVAGSNTTTAAIGAITDKAESQVPVLGYTVPYAVGNILLTIWGSVIVAVLA